MPFETDDPQYLNRRLCSVEIYVPSQLQNPQERFGIIANAWFGTIREEITTANGPKTITFGVHSAMLALETCEKSRISKGGEEGQSRYKSAPLTLAYERRSETDTGNKREGSLGAGFAAPLMTILKLRGEGNISSVRNVTKSEANKQESTFDVYEVATDSPWEWRIQAVNPARPVPRLNGNELSDAALCSIDTPHGTATVTANITISARDLWLDINAKSGQASLEDEANQNAVLAALMAKSIETEGAAQGRVEEGETIIASSTLHRRKQEGEA